jgi:serine/threonine protein kinase
MDSMDVSTAKIQKIVICDFGVSKLLSDGTLGRTFVGTPGFM